MYIGNFLNILRLFLNSTEYEVSIKKNLFFNNFITKPKKKKKKKKKKTKNQKKGSRLIPNFIQVKHGLWSFFMGNRCFSFMILDFYTNGILNSELYIGIIKIESLNTSWAAWPPLPGDHEAVSPQLAKNNSVRLLGV